MADMHVLDARGGTYRVVMHFPVPSGSNAVGVPWSVAIVNHGQWGRTELPDGDGTGGTINATEKAAIAAGTIVEVPVRIDVDGVGQTTAGRRALLQSWYVATKNVMTDGLRSYFDFYGHTESEV